MISDSQILELLRTHKQRGAEALFDRYYRPLVLFTNDIVNDLADAEDIVQEQFIKFWNSHCCNKQIS